MNNNERKPTCPQIRDTLEVNEGCLCSAWLTGSFVTPMKEVTRESDVDVVLAFESFDAMDEFDYDRRYPEKPWQGNYRSRCYPLSAVILVYIAVRLKLMAYLCRGRVSRYHGTHIKMSLVPSFFQIRV
jgi:hypothetical protein